MPRVSLLLLGLLLTGAHAVPISNTASLQARGLRVNSNTVELQRTAPCDPQVTPDGTGTAPGRVLTLRTPGSVALPYTLTQAGDVPGDVTVRATVVTPVPGVQVTLQDAPAGMPITGVMAAGARRTVTVLVVATGAAQGSVDVNVSATCGGAGDPVNVTRLQLQPQLNLLLTHTVTPGRTEAGHVVTFTLALPNPAPQPLGATLTVTLPAGVSYRPGSARVGGVPVPATVGPDGRSVTFRPPAVGVGSTLTLMYDALIGPQALADGGAERTLDVPGVASATVDGETVVSPTATAHVLVTPGVFDRRATVLGEVFLDGNGNGRRDPGDSPLAGARVLLANGQQSLTDVQGRYAFRNVEPGPWLLRLDPSTAPFQAVPGAGDRLVDVAGLTRVDFALRVPTAQGAAPPATPAPAPGTTVRSGPLVVTRRVTPQPGGASVITLTVSSARPVLDVVILDRSGPDGAPREFRVASLDAPVTFTYLTLTPAGPNDPDVLWREP